MTDTRITDFEAVAPMPIYTQADLDAAVQKAVAAALNRSSEKAPIATYLEMLGNGMALHEIAEAHGVTQGSVHMALKRRGLPTCARKYLVWKSKGGSYV